MGVVLVEAFALEGGEAAFERGFFYLEELELGDRGLGTEGSDLPVTVFFDTDDIREFVGHGAGEGDGSV